MKKIINQTFGGERPLYASHDLEIEGVSITAGESSLKECSNITATNCQFDGKYPFWRTFGFRIENCLFKEGARAALWYSEDLLMTHTLVEAPKMFRDMRNLELRNVRLTNAQETLWHCQGIKLRNVEVQKGDYIMMNCDGIEIDGLQLQGNYSFQYSKNIVIRNSVLDTKDAFWETDNCTVYDSTISGEYLAWHSRNLRLVRCHIAGTQPLCYAEGLVLEDCTFQEDADLAFEYSDVKATIKGKISSVKNPHKGFVKADEIGEIIIDENLLPGSDCAVGTDI